MAVKTKKKYLRVKYFRQLLDETQDKFGALIGVSRQQYAKRELGYCEWLLSDCAILTGYINKKLNTTYTVDEIFLQTELPISNK